MITLKVIIGRVLGLDEDTQVLQKVGYLAGCPLKLSYLPKCSVSRLPDSGKSPCALGKLRDTLPNESP